MFWSIKMKWESKQKMLEILILILCSQLRRKPYSSFSSLFLVYWKNSEIFPKEAFAHRCFVEKQFWKDCENSKKIYLMEFPYCQFAAIIPVTVLKRALIFQVCNYIFRIRHFALVELDFFSIFLESFFFYYYWLM